MGKKIFNLRGLRTRINDLIVAEGSLTQADNVEVDERNQLTLRRGFNIYGSNFEPLNFYTSLSNFHSVFFLDRFHLFYNGAYSGGSNAVQIWYDSNGSGTFTRQEIVSALDLDLIQSFSQNNTLFFNTGVGIYCLDALGATAKRAGAPRGLGGFAVLTGIAGFFQPNSQVAYRATVSRTDANSVLIEGAPGSRIEIANATPNFRNVALRILIPPGAVAGDILNIYRSGFSASSSKIANDDMNIVRQFTLTSTEISAGTYSFTDSIPVEVRGEPLYTNRNEDGADQENSRPPWAKRITSYKTMGIYANTKQPHGLEVKLLNVQSGGSAGLQAGDIIALNSTNLTAVTKETLTDGTFTSGAAWVAAGNFSYDSVQDRMLISCTNATPSGTLTQNNGSLALVPTASKRYSLRYTISPSDGAVPPSRVDTYLQLTGSFVNETIYLDMTPGVHEIEFVSGASAASANFVFTLTGSGADTINVYLDDVSLLLVENANNEFTAFTNGTIGENVGRTARSLVECINVSTTPALANIYAYYTSAYNDFPGKIFLQVDNFTETITFDANSARLGASFSPNCETAISSKADIYTNGLYISKAEESHAVPVLNYKRIGSNDSETTLIAATKDYLYVFKSDGQMWYSSGDSPEEVFQNFKASESTLKIRLPELSRNFADAYYIFTNFGFQRVSSAGLNRISVQINDQFESYFQNLTEDTVSYSNESDKKYFSIFDLTSGPGDDYNPYNDPFVYSSESGEWTKQSHLDFGYFYVGGATNPSDERLYLVVYFAQSGAFEVWKQRKDFADTDFVDRTQAVTIVTGGTVSAIYTPPAAWQPKAGMFIRVGSVSKRITDVNQGTSTLTLEDDGQTLSAGSGTFMTPIQFEIETAPLHMGEPDKLKMFSEIVCNFQNLPVGGKVTFGVTTDSNSTRLEWDVDIEEDNIRTWIPDEYMCAKWITLYIKISELEKQIVMLGMEINYTLQDSETLGED